LEEVKDLDDFISKIRKKKIGPSHYNLSMKISLKKVEWRTVIKNRYCRRNFL